MQEMRESSLTKDKIGHYEALYNNTCSDLPNDLLSVTYKYY
jgi:hypothetical protein